MEKIYQKTCEFDLAALLIRAYKKTDKPFWSAFFSAFAALSLIFLFHGVQFMFGDHDWTFLKDGIRLDARVFEGRFTQFILINALAQGEILPIINNILGFIGFCLGGALLAKYWQLPHNKQTYIIFALFTAITPYILSFMYFAFLIIPILSWSAFIIGALVISEKETFSSLRKAPLSTIVKSLISIFLITMALGGYPPVINLLAVTLGVRLLLAICYEKTSIKDLCQHYMWSVINIILALGIYKLCLIYLTKSGALNADYYNLQTTPINEWGSKLLLVIKDIFLQFQATLPFISAFYKGCLGMLAILGIWTIWQNKKQRWLGYVLYFGIFLGAMITLFLSTSLKETEFSPRIDFFGFIYVMSGVLALILRSNNKIIKNIAYVLVGCCLISNTNALFEGQKVWHLGFKTEMNLYKRVARRFQANERFNQYGHYIIVQSGAPSFRKRFYHDKYNYPSDDLLDTAYVPGMASGVMWDYYGIYEYADKTSYVYTFTPDVEFKQKLSEAEVWPKARSTAVGGYWILLILDRSNLRTLQHQYL